mmetsp:Transcript_31329/g.61863  ORF Transcript_31329/g.61863 Transcript_31329/m.61863 type:complete len:231 (+) Transcript_31329:1401-2093(+)
MMVSPLLLMSWNLVGPCSGCPQVSGAPGMFKPRDGGTGSPPRTTAPPSLSSWSVFTMTQPGSSMLVSLKFVTSHFFPFPDGAKSPSKPFNSSPSITSPNPSSVSLDPPGREIFSMKTCPSVLVADRRTHFASLVIWASSNLLMLNPPTFSPSVLRICWPLTMTGFGLSAPMNTVVPSLAISNPPDPIVVGKKASVSKSNDRSALPTNSEDGPSLSFTRVTQPPTPFVLMF